jgi:basic membrane protein A
MKKILALVLALCMVLALCACGTKSETPTSGTDASATNAAANVKIGIVLVGDENVGYDTAHIEGIKAAAKANGIADSQIIWKYNIEENEKCADAIDDLVAQGCNYIFSDSYGHQSYMQQAATDNPNVTFVSMTGDTAATSGLKNFKNAFNYTFQSRYVSGVVAGMKLAELVKDGKVTDANKDKDGNIMIGYVGAFPYAEVVSGYTAFYLGVKSIVSNVVMDVTYTNSWYDPTAEGEAANSLVSDGCIIISQHADSTGAPSACEQLLNSGKTVYCVGYNVDMLSVAPTAALTSAQNDWSVYYTYAFGTGDGGESHHRLMAVPLPLTREAGTGDDGCVASRTPPPTGFYPSRRGSSRGKHAVALLKSRPRGARVNTFPQKRARLRIPPPPAGGPPPLNRGG